MHRVFKRDVVEESIMIGSAIKWIVLSIFVGLTVGFAIGIFVKLVSIGEVAVQTRFHYYYLLLPIVFSLCSFIVLKLAPQAEGHGTEKAIEAVHKNAGKMDIKAMPIKLFTTFLTIVFGGSVGEEGPATQIGAGIASFFSKYLNMDDTDRKRFVMCGLSAGFVGVFGSPVGAAVFAAEVLYIGRFSYLSLLPALISSYVSFFIGRFLGTKPLLMYYINFKRSNPAIMFVKMAIFGIVIGILANIFIELVKWIDDIFKKIKIYKPLKGIIGGIAVILIVLITGGNTNCLGLGDVIINKAVAGGNIHWYDFIAKMFASAITLSAGGNGGILTPMAYIGATFGSIWALIIHGHATFYAAMGMICFLATCSNTPLAGIVMSMELFGSEVGTYSAIACVIGYLVVGHRSIYPTQILVSSKSPSVCTDKYCEIKNYLQLKINKAHHKKLTKIIPIKKFEFEDNKFEDNKVNDKEKININENIKQTKDDDV